MSSGMGDPLRIAMTSLYLPGSSKIGVGHQVHSFANALVARGQRVTVFSPDQPGEGARYEHRWVDPGRRLRTFGFAWALRQVDWSEFDLLHAHGDDHFLVGVPRPPHVRTVHGSCFAEAGHIRGWKAKLRMTLLGVAEVFSTMVVADRSVAVSAATKRVYPWIHDVVPNGIDLDRFAGRRVESDEPTILFVGTYENRKRGRLLVEVFEREVLPRVPDARLWMVCQDAPGDRTAVEVLGRLTDEELADRYRRAWVFCLPSTYEGFGIPYVEAMAAGCPVVATPNPGSLEVLEGGVAGDVVGDDDLGSTLVANLCDEGRRRTTGRKGLEHSKGFGWDVVVGRYRQVYESIGLRNERSARVRPTMSARDVS